MITATAAIAAADIDFFSAEEEAALGEAAKAGDVGARNRLVMSIAPLVVQIVRKRSRRGDVEDRVQQALLKMTLLIIGRWDSRISRLGTLAGIVAAQVCYRRSKGDALVWAGVMGPQPMRLIADAQALDPAEVAELRDEVTMLDTHLRALPPRWREVLLRRLGGETTRAIAVDFGVCKQAVCAYEKRAMRDLRKVFGCEEAAGSLSRRSGLSSAEWDRRVKARTKHSNAQHYQREKAARAANHNSGERTPC